MHDYALNPLPIFGLLIQTMYFPPPHTPPFLGFMQNPLSIMPYGNKVFSRPNGIGSIVAAYWLQKERCRFPNFSLNIRYNIFPRNLKSHFTGICKFYKTILCHIVGNFQDLEKSSKIHRIYITWRDSEPFPLRPFPLRPSLNISIWLRRWSIDYFTAPVLLLINFSCWPSKLHRFKPR